AFLSRLPVRIVGRETGAGSNRGVTAGHGWRSLIGPDGRAAGDRSMSITMQRPLLLVGCGKMGGALLSGWLERGIARAGVVVVEPAGSGAFAANAGVSL